jgi:Winged helix DNA-binding domain
MALDDADRADRLGLARWRLHSQRLAGSPAADPVAVVGDFLGVQAENHPQACWALACRSSGDEASLARLYDAGALLRTHVLRTTWHFVLPDDIGWLLDLSRPRISKTFERQLDQQGIDRPRIDASASVVADSLASEHLTRAELGVRLGAEGLAYNGFQLMVLFAWLELEGLICSGVRRDNDHSYALLAERAPATRRLDPDAARAELTLRYFTGHGPATERDLAYWATLPLRDVRAGLADVCDRLGSVEVGGQTYWYGKDRPDGDTIAPRAHLLQILDEYYRGYQDSRDLLDVAGRKEKTGRESSIGMTIVDSQIVGDLARTVDPGKVTFRIRLLRPLDEEAAVHDAAARYGRFLGRAPVVRLD